MTRVSPALRISVGLVLLTISLLLISDSLGLFPDRAKTVLDARKKICESLAVQLSLAATRSEGDLVQVTVEAFVERNSDVVSARMRAKDGAIIAQAGEHPKQWLDVSGTKSTTNHVKVPIFQGSVLWGSVEIIFTPIAENLWDTLKNSVYGVALFVGLAGFLGYMFILRKSLRELDPTAVIPERVKTVLNTLAEGVLILDEKEHIVLANTAFSDQVKRPVASLIGYKASELGWINAEEKSEACALPWEKAMNEGLPQIGLPLSLEVEDKGLRDFSVNGSPILDDRGRKRGVLITFDDVTELENKNKELHRLATRDPLTGCFNRRSFFEAFETLFEDAKHEDLKLSCIMTDLDHFKSINDKHGHAVGDEVIKFMAELLKSKSRGDDIVGRYGGEEFCLLLPGLDHVQASTIAERIRHTVQDESAIRFGADITVTASFGVSSLLFDPKDHNELIHQADQALYRAKDRGRNQVVCWDDPEPLKTEDKTHVLKTVTTVDNTAETAVQPTDSSNVVHLPKKVKGVATKKAVRGKEYDPVTGLPNHLLFFDRIIQSIAYGRRYNKMSAVLSLFVDLFQDAEQKTALEERNALFKNISELLSAMLRGTDTVAYLGADKSPPMLSRIGKDEFGLLLTDLDTVESVVWVVRRILDRLSKHFIIDGREVYLNTAMGISVFPYDGESPDILVSNARTARKRAMEDAGQKKYHFYSRQANKRSWEQLRLESQLRQAIDNEEFVLHYQPKFDVKTNEVTSFEALVRWQHPERGLILPGEFIPLAEHTGLIGPIGRLVLRSACQQATKWNQTDFPNLRIAINLSAVQFRQQDVSQEVRTVLKDTGLKPHHLELEITESGVMENINVARALLEDLAELGVNVVIDDFGTGYSSLSYLKTFPISSFKIDRSFLEDVFTDTRSKGLYNAIVAIAGSLGLKTAAEGIETEDQLNFVRQAQCDEMQGYLLGKPVAAQAATEFLYKARNKDTIVPDNPSLSA